MFCQRSQKSAFRLKKHSTFNHVNRWLKMLIMGVSFVMRLFQSLFLLWGGTNCIVHCDLCTGIIAMRTCVTFCYFVDMLKKDVKALLFFSSEVIT